MIEVLPIPSALTPAVLPQIAADIERALEHGGDFDLDDAAERLAAKDWQLWVVTDNKRSAGVVITHIAVRPKAKVVEIVLLSGENAKRWMPRAEEVIAEWAAELGCVAMEAAGRTGWERRMTPAGWKRQAVVIRKELAHA